MAAFTHIMQRVRRARREEAPPETQQFETYEPQYRTLLEAVDALGGEPLVKALVAWMIDRTHETGRLPTPEAVTQRARRLCSEQDIDIPTDSILT